LNFKTASYLKYCSNL